ncbi:hypothetical protein BDV93DRAFT_547185 [Ceratobasidium sp. AG-I]|nr:hypothetical protein BDV93DRAFT_547182 [Ceratobasidium sp. AG-I]KAF8598883.1 hypothetical protein BDV93DRAFT_547185 [Ceratobasidium sp. AG-I]
MTIKTMIDKIVTFFKSEMAVPIHPTELGALFETAVLSLKEKSDKGYANFFAEDEGSTYVYRVVIPYLDSGAFNFYALVTTLQLKANLNEESGWWSLRSDTTVKLSGKVMAMEYLVSQKFKAPSKEQPL